MTRVFGKRTRSFISVLLIISVFTQNALAQSAQNQTTPSNSTTLSAGWGNITTALDPLIQRAVSLGTNIVVTVTSYVSPPSPPPPPNVAPAPAASTTPAPQATPTNTAPPSSNLAAYTTEGFEPTRRYADSFFSADQWSGDPMDKAILSMKTLAVASVPASIVAGLTANKISNLMGKGDVAVIGKSWRNNRIARAIDKIDYNRALKNATTAQERLALAKKFNQLEPSNLGKLKSLVTDGVQNGILNHHLKKVDADNLRLEQQRSSLLDDAKRAGKDLDPNDPRLKAIDEKIQRNNAYADLQRGASKVTGPEQVDVPRTAKDQYDARMAEHRTERFNKRVEAELDYNKNIKEARSSPNNAFKMSIDEHVERLKSKDLDPVEKARLQAQLNSLEAEFETQTKPALKAKLDEKIATEKARFKQVEQFESQKLKIDQGIEARVLKAEKEFSARMDQIRSAHAQIERIEFDQYIRDRNNQEKVYKNKLDEVRKKARFERAQERLVQNPLATDTAIAESKMRVANINKLEQEAIQNLTKDHEKAMAQIESDRRKVDSSEAQKVAREQFEAKRAVLEAERYNQEIAAKKQVFGDQFKASPIDEAKLKHAGVQQRLTDDFFANQSKIDIERANLDKDLAAVRKKMAGQDPRNIQKEIDSIKTKYADRINPLERSRDQIHAKILENDSNLYKELAEANQQESQARVAKLDEAASNRRLAKDKALREKYGDEVAAAEAKKRADAIESSRQKMIDTHNARMNNEMLDFRSKIDTDYKNFNKIQELKKVELQSQAIEKFKKQPRLDNALQGDLVNVKSRDDFKALLEGQVSRRNSLKEAYERGRVQNPDSPENLNRQRAFEKANAKVIELEQLQKDFNSLDAQIEIENRSRLEQLNGQYKAKIDSLEREDKLFKQELKENQKATLNRDEVQRSYQKKLEKLEASEADLKARIEAQKIRTEEAQKRLATINESSPGNRKLVDAANLQLADEIRNGKALELELELQKQTIAKIKPEIEQMRELAQKNVQYRFDDQLAQARNGLEGSERVVLEKKAALEKATASGNRDAIARAQKQLDLATEEQRLAQKKFEVADLERRRNGPFLAGDEARISDAKLDNQIRQTRLETSVAEHQLEVSRAPNEQARSRAQGKLDAANARLAQDKELMEVRQRHWALEDQLNDPRLSQAQRAELSTKLDREIQHTRAKADLLEKKLKLDDLSRELDVENRARAASKNLARDDSLSGLAQLFGEGDLDPIDKEKSRAGSPLEAKIEKLKAEIAASEKSKSQFDTVELAKERAVRELQSEMEPIVQFDREMDVQKKKLASLEQQLAKTDLNPVERQKLLQNQAATKKEIQKLKQSIRSAESELGNKMREVLNKDVSDVSFSEFRAKAKHMMDHDDLQRSFNKADQDLKLRKADLEKLESDFKAGKVSQAEFSEAKARVKVEEAKLKVKQNELELAERRAKGETITPREQWDLDAKRKNLEFEARVREGKARVKALERQLEIAKERELIQGDLGRLKAEEVSKMNEIEATRRDLEKLNNERLTKDQALTQATKNREIIQDARKQQALELAKAESKAKQAESLLQADVNKSAKNLAAAQAAEQDAIAIQDQARKAQVTADQAAETARVRAAQLASEESTLTKKLGKLEDLRRAAEEAENQALAAKSRAEGLLEQQRELKLKASQFEVQAEAKKAVAEAMEKQAKQVEAKLNNLRLQAQAAQEKVARLQDQAQKARELKTLSDERSLLKDQKVDARKAAKDADGLANNAQQELIDLRRKAEQSRDAASKARKQAKDLSAEAKAQRRSTLDLDNRIAEANRKADQFSEEAGRLRATSSLESTLRQAKQDVRIAETRASLAKSDLLRATEDQKEAAAKRASATDSLKNLEDQLERQRKVAQEATARANAAGDELVVFTERSSRVQQELDNARRKVLEAKNKLTDLSAQERQLTIRQRAMGGTLNPGESVEGIRARISATEIEMSRLAQTQRSELEALARNRDLGRSPGANAVDRVNDRIRGLKNQLSENVMTLEEYKLRLQLHDLDVQIADREKIRTEKGISSSKLEKFGNNTALQADRRRVLDRLKGVELSKELRIENLKDQLRQLEREKISLVAEQQSASGRAIKAAENRVLLRNKQMAILERSLQDLRAQEQGIGQRTGLARDRALLRDQIEEAHSSYTQALREAESAEAYAKADRVYQDRLGDAVTQNTKLQELELERSRLKGVQQQTTDRLARSPNISELAGELDNATREAQAARERANAAEKALLENRGKMDDLNRDAAISQGNARVAESRSRLLSGEADQLRGRVGAVEERIRELEQQAEIARDRAHKLEELRKGAPKRIAVLNESASLSDFQARTLKRDLEERQTQIVVKDAEFKTQAAIAEKQNAIAETASKRSKELKAEINRLQSEVDNLEGTASDRINVAAARAEALDQELARAQADQLRIDKQVSALEGQQSSLKKNLSKTTGEIERLNGDATTANLKAGQIDAALAEASQANQTAKDAKRRVAAAEEALDNHAQQEIDLARRDLEIHVATIDEKAEALKKLESDQEALRRTRTAGSQGIQDIEAQLSSARDELAEVRGQGPGTPEDARPDHTKPTKPKPKPDVDLAGDSPGNRVRNLELEKAADSVVDDAAESAVKGDATALKEAKNEAAKEGRDWMICGQAAMFTFQVVQRSMSVANIEKTKRDAVSNINKLFGSTPEIYSDSKNATGSGSGSGNNNGQGGGSGSGNNNSQGGGSGNGNNNSQGGGSGNGSNNGRSRSGGGEDGTYDGGTSGQDQTDMPGLNRSFALAMEAGGVPPHASKLEASIIKSAGGLEGLLSHLPMDPATFVHKAKKEGPAAALESIMPEMGEISPAMSEFLHALEKDAHKVAAIFPKDNVPGGGIAETVVPLPEGVAKPKGPVANADALKEMILKAKPKRVVSGKVVKTVSRSEKINGPDIWHKNTDLNLFQIVSEVTKRASPRVLH